MYAGIALGGGKGAGKTMIQEYLLNTRPSFVPIYAKMGIVDEYMKAFGHDYVKSRDDAELIEWSDKVLKPTRGSVVLGGLDRQVAKAWSLGQVPISADLRMPDENAWFAAHKFLQIYVESPEELRKERIIARDGDLRNYKPDDDTEKFYQDLKYQYIITNDCDIHALYVQVERVVSQFFPASVNADTA
jgi:hypothetical protein